MSNMSDYSRTRYKFLNRITQRKLLVLSFLLGMAPASAALAAEGSQSWEQSVLEANESSIVFINVAATRTNGLVDPFTGTGFIVHSDGFVLTCNHVIPKEEAPYKSVVATGSVGSRYEYPQPLQVILRDEQRDLALLKLPMRASRWRSVESAAQGKNGSRILVLGFPLNENLLGVPGLITGTDGRGGRWLTNAAINRGMSGGLVFDQLGAVIAVAVAGYEEAQGLNLVIPISFARGILDSVDVNSLFRAASASQKVGDPEFMKKRTLALLLGYDGAFALAHALMNKPIVQERSRLSEYLRQLNLEKVYFPADPLGEKKDATPASAFAQEVVGTLEARDVRLQRAFLAGWLGVISINTPTMKPEGFDLRSFTKDAGFPDQVNSSDAEYLESLVEQERSKINSKPPADNNFLSSKPVQSTRFSSGADSNTTYWHLCK